MSNDKYIHTDVEDKIYSYWEKNNLFKPTKNKKKFSNIEKPLSSTSEYISSTSFIKNKYKSN